MASISNFFSELRRRNVFKAGGAYVAGGWVFYQIADVVLPLVGAPGWVTRALAALLLIGIPFVLGFAWAFELTPEGLKRTADIDPTVSQTRQTGQKILYLIAGLLAIAVGLQFVGSFSGPSSGTPTPAEAQSYGPATLPDDADAIAVMPFQTSGPATEVWRTGMMSMLTTNLDGMGTLRAVDVRTVLARLRERGAETKDADLQTTLDAARATGAATAVVGDVVSTGKTVRLSAVLYDTESAAVIRRLQIEGPEADFLNLVDRLTIQAVEAARSSETGASPLPVPNVSALTTESLPALRAYLKGEDLNRRARNQEALPYLRQAVELDSTFAMAAYGLAMVTNATRDATTDMVQDVQRRLRQAQRHGDRLPPREKSFLDGFVAYAIDGNAARAAGEYEAGLNAHPTDPEFAGAYGETLWGQPNIRPGALAEGIDALRRAIQLDSSLAWAYVPVISHQISTGDTTAARRLLAAYVRQDPDTTASGMLRSLQGALDLAYGDSTAQAMALQQLRDGAYPRRGTYLLRALEVNPTPKALRAQTDIGMILSDQGLYGLRTMSWVFRGRYQDVRTFIRDTTETSVFARLARQQAASVLLERGALAASAVPDDLLRATCEMDVEVSFRIFGCYHEARIAMHRERAGLPGKDAVNTARSVLGRSIKDLDAAGDGAFGTIATGFQSLISGMAAMDQGDAKAPGSIQEAYEPLLLIMSYRDWEPIAESVRAQIRAGDAAAALPYAEMITAQDPYGHYLAGRAHEALSQSEAARESYQQFVTAWRDADPDIPALQHAKAVLAEDPSAEAPPL